VFEIAFSQQLQRATPLAGSIFGELFCNFLGKIQAFQISGQTLVSKGTKNMSTKVINPKWADCGAEMVTGFLVDQRELGADWH